MLNVPKEDLESFERILFLMEQAHWFYEDNSVEQNPSLRSLSFKEFTVLSTVLSSVSKPINCDDIQPFCFFAFLIFSKIEVLVGKKLTESGILGIHDDTIS